MNTFFKTTIKICRNIISRIFRHNLMEEEEKKLNGDNDSQEIMDLENEGDVEEIFSEKKSEQEFDRFIAIVNDCTQFLKEALKPPPTGGSVTFVEYRGVAWQGILKSQELLMESYKKPNLTHPLIKFMTNVPSRGDKDPEISLFQHLSEFIGDFCLLNELRYEDLEGLFGNSNFMRKTLGGPNANTGFERYLRNEYYENTFYAFLMVMTYWALLLIQNAKQLEELYLQGNNFKQVTEYNLVYYLSMKSLDGVVENIEQLLSESNPEAVTLETFTEYFKDRVEMIQMLAKLEDYVTKIAGFSLRDSLVEYVTSNLCFHCSLFITSIRVFTRFLTFPLCFIYRFLASMRLRMIFLLVVALFAKEYKVLPTEKDPTTYEFVKDIDSNENGDIQFEIDEDGQRVHRISWEPIDEILKFALLQTINPSTKPINCMFHYVRELFE